MTESVVINGVRYVPDPTHADNIKFYFMHDGHYFSRLYGTTLDEILANADEIESGENGSYGMLCPAILMSGEKEVRRVGTPAHARGSKDTKENWNIGKENWRQAIESDTDVMRLLPTNSRKP